MVLRVNTSKISVTDYCAKLGAQQIPFTLAEPNGALVLATPNLRPACLDGMTVK